MPGDKVGSQRHTNIMLMSKYYRIIMDVCTICKFKNLLCELHLHTITSRDQNCIANMNVSLYYVDLIVSTIID